MLGDGKGGLVRSAGLAVLPAERAPQTRPRPETSTATASPTSRSRTRAATSRSCSATGAGKLTPRRASPFGFTPAAVGAGDFNGDGKLDVAVANTGGTSRS